MFASAPFFMFVFYVFKVLMTFIAFEIYQISSTVAVYGVTFYKIHLI